MTNQIIIKAITQSSTSKRIAAYIRVSTDKDDQLNSFAAQYIHYKEL